ncbi:hypothetical protein CR513_38881, partial [Mucuna pruriens]
MNAFWGYPWRNHHTISTGGSLPLGLNSKITKGNRIRDGKREEEPERSRRDSEILLKGKVASTPERWDWPAVMDVYGLLVYGTILFPHGDDYVDLTIVDAYLIKRDKGENPTIALLANTKRETTCPVEDFKWSWIKTMSRDLWIR